MIQDNTAADHFSRIFLIQETTSEDRLEEMIFLNSIYEAQRESPPSEETIRSLDLSQKKVDEKKVWMYKNRLYLPDEYSIKLLTLAHSKLNHSGITKTYNTIKSYLTTQNMGKKITDITEGCSLCNQNKPFRANYGAVSGFLHSDKPLADIATDIYGPIDLRHFNEEEKGYVLSNIDQHSRYTVLRCLRNITGSEVANAIEKHWIDKLGIPKTILSDQGRQYTSKEYETLCKKHGIKIKLTTAYNPTGNSITERTNQAIGLGLRNSKGQDCRVLGHSQPASAG